VATAIYDGADAVMLSAETASGDYPIDAVAIMNRIIERVEEDGLYQVIRDASRPAPESTTRDAISAAARQVAHTLEVCAVVTFTSSGSTTLRLARERPDVPILCITPTVSVGRQMAMVWGVHGIVAPDLHSFAEMVAVGVQAAHDQGFAQWKDKIVITAGVPFGKAGSTNVLRVASVEEP
jgi:pyruvate kinase